MKLATILLYTTAATAAPPTESFFGDITCQDDHKVKLGTEGFTKYLTLHPFTCQLLILLRLYKTFCANVNLTKGQNTEVKAAQAGVTNDHYIAFFFKWLPEQVHALDGLTCVRSCEEIYEHFLDSKDCSHHGHMKSNHGYLETKCGTADFDFIQK